MTTCRNRATKATSRRFLETATKAAAVCVLAAIAGVVHAQPGGPPSVGVAITSGPAQGSTSPATEVFFDFATEGDVGAWCSLDGLPARPCSSPVGYEGLATGPHTFVVSVALPGAAASDMRSWIVGRLRDGHPATPQPDADDDGDGIRNADDACPGTFGELPSLARGCAAVEITARPERLVAPLRAALGRGRAAFDDPLLFGKSSKQVLQAFDRSEHQLDLGVKLLERGLVCTGARHVELAEQALAKSQGEAKSLVTGLLGDIDSQTSPDDGDADLLEVSFQEVLLRYQSYLRAEAAAQSASHDAGRLCEAVAGRQEVSAVVERTLDAEGLVVLEGGQVMVAGGQKALNAGSTVRGTAVLFDDGTGFFEKLTGPVTAGVAPNVTIECLLPRIAPFQRFVSTPPSSVTLHDLRGYLVDGSLQLESLARLGVESAGCPTDVQPGDPDDIPTEVFRYSLLAEYKNDGPWTVWASDLQPGEPQLPLPQALEPIPGSTVTAQLRFTVRSQVCNLLFQCSAPTALSSRTYSATIHPVGELGSLRYNTTVFELDDWDPDDYRITFVEDVDLAPVIEAGVAGLDFSGEGYSTSGDGTIVPVNLANPFVTVVRIDLVDPTLPGAPGLQGTTKASGLRWPRVTGFRNGYPFWYAADPPLVVRDRVEECTGMADSFYHYPWADGVERNVGQGNAPPSTGSHNGSGQQFAFDIGFGIGDEIRAARGGIVDAVVENMVLNLNSLDLLVPGSAANFGNYVRIRHESGSFSWYFHLDVNGAWVNVGDRVQRGQPIAAAGNTGRSSGPHLHYQVSGSAANWSQTIPISFECVVPVSGVDVTSNNSNPNFP